MDNLTEICIPESDTIRRNALIAISLITLGFVASVTWHYIKAQYFGLGYPASTFLFTPLDKFNDFFHPFQALKATGNPYSDYALHGVLMPYLPFAFVLLEPFTILDPKAAFIVFSLMSIVLFYVLAYWTLCRFLGDKVLSLIFSGALVISIYPFAFQLDRGNIEIFVFGLIALFLWAWRKDKAWALVPLAAAIAMKLYPGVLLFLFVGRKQYRSFFAAGALSLLLIAGGYCLVALWSGSPLLSVVSEQLTQMALHKPTYSYTFAGLQHNHTLWGYFLGINSFWASSHGKLLLSWSFSSLIYTIGVIVLFIGSAAYVSFSKSDDWRKLTVLMTCMLVFPYTSFDYTLIHWCFVPVAYIAWQRRKASLPMLLLLVVPMVPMDYIAIRGDATSSILIYPAAMVATALISVISGRKEKE